MKSIVFILLVGQVSANLNSAFISLISSEKELVELSNSEENNEPNEEENKKEKENKVLSNMNTSDSNTIKAFLKFYSSEITNTLHHSEISTPSPELKI